MAQEPQPASVWQSLLGIGTCMFFVVFLAAGGLIGCPKYKVWLRRMEGEGNLMKAEQEKKIQIEQAKAEVESAKLRAEAIKTVGEAAKQYPEYRHQEFIGAFAEALKEGNIDQIIYVPTEANIPITEAGRQRLSEVNR